MIDRVKKHLADQLRTWAARIDPEGEFQHAVEVEVRERLARGSQRKPSGPVTFGGGGGGGVINGWTGRTATAGSLPLFDTSGTTWQAVGRRAVDGGDGGPVVYVEARR